jgi:DNA processing protein
VDGHAHRGALAAGGRTLAVLGSGVDVIYPSEHAPLAAQVVEQGALISEAPLGSPPTADAFPRRNRIIVGLALGVLVVEATRRSGALISARLASDYNREVFAVPGRLDASTAAGPHQLIRSGAAKLVTGLGDILDELGEVGEALQPAGDDEPVACGPASDALTCAAADGAVTDPRMDAVLAHLGGEPRHFNELVTMTGLSPGVLAGLVTRLQLAGHVTVMPGNLLSRRR